MSGHSKWSQIKRKKAATDQARGKAFSKLIKEITIAARQGGGDPAANVRLRNAIQAAKGVNMPAGNVERAIQRGTGAVEGATYEELHYEGYGPGGVAILVEVATDNRNRTGGDIRNLLAKHGGNLAEVGAVAYLFKPRGVIEVARGAIGEDALMEMVLEAGADDLATGADSYEVLTPTGAFEDVKAALAAKGIPIVHAELTRLATLQVPVAGKTAESVLRLIEVLEDHEDVQKVYSNFSVDDDVLARISH